MLFAMALSACATWTGPRTTRSTAVEAAQAALRMRGRPYHYGGDRPAEGFDCSGLIHYAYARSGVYLPRTAEALSQLGRPVSQYHLQPGDLLFFYERGVSYGHVGIYIGHGLFEHAPAPHQRVRLESLRNAYWRRHFSGVRRLW